MTLNIPLLYVLRLEEYCQISPNKSKSPNLWHITSILFCCIFGCATLCSKSEVMLIKVKHENSTPEQCDECNRAFGTPHALKAHKYNMHKRSKCEICGQSLCNTFWLKRHMSASHGIMPEGSIPCSHCPLFFSSKGAKDNHVKKQHADLFKVWTIGF